MNNNIGTRVIDIGELVDVFEAQEGEIHQIIGKTGNGKTYEGTRRALELLKQGCVVYTTWQLILPEFYDEREDKQKLFWNTLFLRKRFYKFDYKNNWHFLDIDRPDLIEFVSGLTDCTVFLDEGQDIFDSRERISKPSRKSLTRTRHMRKTLIIISQRAQAVDITARANVTYFFKCVKNIAWFWPFKAHFKVYRTEEQDQSNYPVWEDLTTGWEAEIWHSGFARKEVYNSYNSWYLRAGIPKSQEVRFEAFDLTVMQKIKLFFTRVKKEEIKMSEEMINDLAEKNRVKYLEATTYIPKKTRKLAIKKDLPTLPEESIIEA